jgi:uncharacterized protein YjbI with pentapeptide repeats
VLVMAKGKGTPWTLREFWGKPVWDWLQLLGVLAIPVVIAVGGCMFNAQQDARQQQMERQRAKVEREIEEQRAQDEALQSYLDQMSGLLLEKDLRASEQSSEVRTLARARTLTVLQRLEDPDRKTTVILFLVEADLLRRVEGRAPIVGLSQLPVVSEEGQGSLDQGGWKRRGAALGGVDLSGVTLRGAELRSAKLQSANLAVADLRDADLFFADLRDANLYNSLLDGADLARADLRGANLRLSHPAEANLAYATLSGANLTYATLSGAYLSSANLRGADLRYADLRGAILIGADLSNVDLRDAELQGATLSDARGITSEELEKQAKTLEGATMPNGQKYEDWLKSKGPEKNGENSSHS